MRRSKILAKLRSGQIARLCATGSPISFFPAVAAQAGYDGVWVDGEHRPWDAREAETMIGRHHAADIDCMWRPPTKEKNALYRLLEDGAAGLMIPHVASAEEAMALVQAVKFPPLGDRGSAAAEGTPPTGSGNLPTTWSRRTVRPSSWFKSKPRTLLKMLKRLRQFPVWTSSSWVRVTCPCVWGAHLPSTTPS